MPLAVMAGAGLAFYALIGFEDSVNVAEETRDPQRNYPRALFGGLLIAGVDLPRGDAWWRSMVVPTDKLAASTGRCSRSSSSGRWRCTTKLFAAIALFAVANGALINMIMASRLLYGMSGRASSRALFATVHARPADAVGRDRVHDAAGDGPRLDRRPRARSPTPPSCCC